MSNREALRKELEGLPDPIIGEVVDFVRLLKSRGGTAGDEFWRLLDESFGSIPGIERPPQGEMPPPRNVA